MNTMIRLAAILSLAAAIPTTALAGVTIRQLNKSGGFQGLGAHAANGTRRIQGMKSRDESSFKFTGAVLGAFGGKGKESTEILRLDLGKRWSLEPKKKKYSESDITAAAKRDLQEARRETAKNSEDSKPAHRIKSTKFDIEKKGGKKEINGFPTEGYELTFTMEIEDLSTKEVSKFKMVSDQRLTPWTSELKAAQKEETAFTQAYMKKLGWELSPEEQKNMGTHLLAMMTQAGGKELDKAMGEFQRKSSRLDGYPIIVDTRWYSQNPPGPKSKAAMDEDEDDINLTGGASGFLAGLAKKAAKKKIKEKARERGKDGEPSAAFSVYHEILEVYVRAIPGELFEIPEGYKKAD